MWAKSLAKEIRGKERQQEHSEALNVEGGAKA